MKNRILALMLLLASANVVMTDEGASPAAAEAVVADQGSQDGAVDAEETKPVENDADVKDEEAKPVENDADAKDEEMKPVENDGDASEKAEEEQAKNPVVSTDKTYKSMAVDFVNGLHSRSINFVNENPHAALAIVFAAGAVSHWVAEVAYEKLWCADNN